MYRTQHVPCDIGRALRRRGTALTTLNAKVVLHVQPQVSDPALFLTALQNAVATSAPEPAARQAHTATWSEVGVSIKWSLSINWSVSMNLLRLSALMYGCPHYLVCVEKRVGVCINWSVRINWSVSKSE